MRKLFLILMLLLIPQLAFAQADAVYSDAVDIEIEDSGGYFTGTEVETALQ